MKFNKFLFAVAVMLFAFVSEVAAQYERLEGDNNNGNGNRHTQDRREWFLTHFSFGGNIGFGIGNCTYFTANPCIGYRFNNYVTAGIIGTYEYYKYNYTYGPTFSTNIYGGGVYAEAFPLDFLTIHAEAQYLNFDNSFDASSYNPNSERIWDIPILVGAGYRRQISDIISVNLMLLFNINNTKELRYNVYENPIIRVNIMF